MTERAPVSGFFLVFEGPEGAGKTTQARLIATALTDAGHTVVATREPGGTQLGDRLRSLLLTPEGGSACAILPESEALLYAAARAEHVRAVVLPGLRSGAVVVSDRYVDSSLAYQGGGLGLDMDALRGVQAFATGGLIPHLRILLDLPVERGLVRRFADAGSVNRMDSAGVAFHRRVRDAYHALVREDPSGWAVIDADRGADMVAADVRAAVVGRLPGVDGMASEAGGTGTAEGR